MRSRLVLALRQGRNLNHDLRRTADNASRPRPGAPALACSPRTKRAEQHVGAAPVRVAGQLWFEQRVELARLKAAVKVAHRAPPIRQDRPSWLHRYLRRPRRSPRAVLCPLDRKCPRLNSSHYCASRMPSFPFTYYLSFFFFFSFFF